MTDIMIVDDQRIVRDGLKMILMDLRMRVMTGVEATKAVKETYPAAEQVMQGKRLLTRHCF
ncbi:MULTISPECIES: hypothetical protein [Brevibacillus]|jgi:YesN/AraC family two-component response regulator|uniref:Uncharacterized protein n=1 Tax=Brevibacillus borstelensis AK1 TaxID=1300222 RepID=M8DD05_9BACL|nr:hypothetical protein [Brevibacillus borstelensis]EMT51272.1 hypothetical protein I532_18667 [Brevibacillus borstelensis AK1]MCC0565136.1 hypothetical protein [Brevibacillus borstelensis]MCM3591643.1 hypothetical protein [Brevibacillus borstelensis]MCM3623406.1 hypothetical protein [Brevibacillus borstelensis]MED1854925.1 hypothetical protein [Brevibacillus borstelensis]